MGIGGSFMRFIVSSLILASAGTLLSSVSVADACHGPNVPDNFPDATTASQADMVAAQQSVKQYLSDMESVLKCMESAHQDHAHDQAIEDMKRVAAKFNAVLHAFRAKQNA
jgi:hypothetical protein